MFVSLKVKARTPLAQIEGNKTEWEEMERKGRRKIEVVKIKRKKILTEDGIVEIPIYTGNGLRGLLRRILGEMLFLKAVEKGLNFTTKDFHIVMSGGGTDLADRQKEEVERKIRELNPILSLLGFGLILEGKIAVSDLDPVVIQKNLIGRYKIVKKDDILDKSKYARVLSKEQREEWVREVEEKRKKENEKKQKQEKKKKIEEEAGDVIKEENGDEREEKEAIGIKMVLTKEYIPPGTVMNGFITEIDELTDLEKGALIVGLEKLVYERLGSSKNLGWGVVEYNINIKDNGKTVSFLETEWDEKAGVKVVKDNSFEFEEEKKLFLDYLDNLTEDNIQIYKLLDLKERKKK